MNKSLKPAAHILHGNHFLQRLLKQAQTLSQLQTLVHGYLAPAAREQLQLGSYENGVLTLVLAEAAWATRLRYQQDRLLGQLRQHPEFSSLQRIQLKIRPAGNAPEPAEKERRYISESASQHICDGAANIEDPKLREALQRLAKNIRQN